MQAEDFSGTGGGVPDLFLWNVEYKTAKFVEVKGPGDTLSEKQRVSPEPGVSLYFIHHSFRRGSMS
jgi:hypothetical protein